MYKLLNYFKSGLKVGNELYNDALSTFYSLLYRVKYRVNDLEKGDTFSPVHGEAAGDIVYTPFH